jgi:RHS repeat-associated protein
MKAPANDKARTEKEQKIFNTGGAKTKSNAIEVPSITLPKGGGAIKGIDEKFSVNAVNGTAAFSIPLPFSPARGASPSLSLSYNSGAGNGPFGLGWSLSLASIKRKSDKGLPQYIDSINSDTFLFSEAEDLVPAFRKELDGSFSMDADGDYVIYEKDSGDGLHTIRFYKPRVEGSFARIERWLEKSSDIIKWRVITRDNSTTLFGWTIDAVVADPQNGKRIVEWLPEFVMDDKGNCCQYCYKKEDDKGFDAEILHNRNRLSNGTITYTNVYLEKILYGNKVPYKKFGDAFPPEGDYMFQTVFDYGEYDVDSPYLKVKDWDFRIDSFSNYRSGFEIRTTRLCKRVLLFHYFNELPGGHALVRSVNFEYDSSAEHDFTFLKSVTASGYIKKPDGTYTSKKLPAREFEYQTHDWNKDVKTIATEDLVHSPIGLDEEQYHFTDLFNEGLAGLLSEQANGLYYKHNLGGGKFERAKLLTKRPSFTGLGNELQIVDLDGDGAKQIVNFANEPKGYFEMDDENEWKPFRYFQNLPNIDLGDGNTRLVDLNGDGKPELLISEDNVFTWYRSEGRNGFASSERTVKTIEEEAGPHVVFADQKQTIFLADMSGDGMTDIVRIRNGEVCYWPNLGYGKFGHKVAMDNAPVFDSPDSDNPSFLRLADIDGSGTADIIYLGKNKFTCWMNFSGNRFAPAPFEIDAFPEIHKQASITVTDLLGNGVSCIVCSSNLSKDAQSPLKYIDLMNSRKPHIMVFYKNNLGKEVTMEYTPSTKFYIQDKLAGTPWVTKLHFPIQCISKIQTRDKISGYRLVSSYTYHHGYYDHPEKEFRGFGMVEQTDAEHFENWTTEAASNVVEKELHQEPVITKTWVHTGAFLGREKILDQFAHGYWYEEMARQGFTIAHHEVSLPDARLIVAPEINPAMIDHLSAQEWREALRACKGMTLRSEKFAHDAVKYGNTDEARKKELTPFSVATHNCVIEILQPKGKNKHAIFAVRESEAVTYSYERNIEDPRIAHSLNIRFDELSNVLESASVVYSRILDDMSLPEETRQSQSKTVIIYSQNQFTNDVISDDVYRLRLPSEVKSYDLKGVAKAGLIYAIDDFLTILTDANEVVYHAIDHSPAAGSPEKRLIEHVRNYYYRNDLTAALSLHSLESLAITYESFQLAYTPELITDIYGTKVNDALLDEGKFVHNNDTNWWIRSGTIQFIEGAETVSEARNRFYLPVSYTNSYGGKSKVKYDTNYFLSVRETEDPLGNKTSVDVFNFRTLSSQRMRDINNNLSEVIVDELGMVKAMAIFGKGNEADDLSGQTEHTTATEQNAIDTFFTTLVSTDLIDQGKGLLLHASSLFVYDFDVYKNTGKPAVVAAIVREEHFQKNSNSPIQISFTYTNGLGQVVMKKVQAEPGVAKKVNVNVDNTYTVTAEDTTTFNPQQLRWIGNGRTILNNKGNKVKQYEPYFSVSHRYEDLKELVEVGVTPILFYDAIGRLIKTEQPDGTLSKVEFNSWMQKNYDQNDTVKESDWYKRRTDITRPDYISNSAEQAAAAKAVKHANTPDQLHFDTLGRPILSIEHNKNITTEADEFYHTKIKLDAEGNLRTVTDARDNIVTQYKFDMLGTLAYQKSMDSGQRWLLNNILSKPLRTWDEREHEFQYFYDIAQRPTYRKVMIGDGSAPLDNIFDRVIYGESLLTGSRTQTNRFNEAALQNKNILGEVIQHYDTGGLVDTPAYDFKGEPIATTRKLFSKYKEVANWKDPNLLNDLEPGVGFSVTTLTDALGRITQQTTPDGSIISPSYNEAGLLKGEAVLHPGASSPSIYIKVINYNERGQRNKIIYGNDVYSKFYYDKETFLLERLESKRFNGDPLQDWHYVCDPVANIVHIEDKNIPVVFFDNQKITGVSTYTYDALYRLVAATGRENTATLNFGSCDNWNDKPYMHAINPGDPMAIRNYNQRYWYDEVGNIVEIKHIAAAGDWTRTYQYETNNNRLKSTHIGDNGNPVNYTKYSHHAKHGFMEELPHLEKIGWNFKEEVVFTTRQHCTDDNIPVITYYQYDSNGQRIRKITEDQASGGTIPTKKEERIYLGGYESYKKFTGTHAGLERESLSLMDESYRFVTIETRNAIDDGTDVQLVRYQLHNHLGSTALELDGTANARIISYEEYHPYGSTAYQAKSASIKAAAKRYRYTGRERDEETGMEYHSARYYLPWLGRWLSSDPIGLKAGPNSFNYCNGNPIIRTDAKGTDWEVTWRFWQWEPINFTREEIVPTAKVFSGNVVGTAHAIFGYDTDRDLDPDQAAGYEWAQSTFRWQRFKPVQKLRDKIISSPTASKVVANTLGFMSAFVPFAPSGDDLPESMQYDYKRMSFAASSTAMLMGLSKPPQGTSFSQPRSPALVTNTGSLVTAAPSAVATTGFSPYAMAMSALKNAVEKGLAKKDPPTSKKVTHKGVATDILKANQEHRSNQTVLTARIKLKNGQEQKVAIPNTPFNGEDAAWRAGQREVAQKAGYTPLETPKNSVPGMHAEENLGAYIKEQGGGSVLDWAIARGDEGTSFICKSATCRTFTSKWGPQQFK